MDGVLKKDNLQQKSPEEKHEGGGKMEYKQDEDFAIELSDKLGKSSNIS